jgi:hypothetical protein
VCSAYVQNSALNKACISSEDPDMGLRSHSGRRRKCSSSGFGGVVFPLLGGARVGLPQIL